MCEENQIENISQNKQVHQYQTRLSVNIQLKKKILSATVKVLVPSCQQNNPCCCWTQGKRDALPVLTRARGSYKGSPMHGHPGDLPVLPGGPALPRQPLHTLPDANGPQRSASPNTQTHQCCHRQSWCPDDTKNIIHRTAHFQLHII